VDVTGVECIALWNEEKDIKMLIWKPERKEESRKI
jgi:hypothetical protein